MRQDRLPSGTLQRSALRALSPSIRLDGSISFLLLLFLIAPPASAGPFDDPGWSPQAMVAWASAVGDFTPGFQDIAQPWLGLASFGLPENALGPATSDSLDAVSLGDAGSITLFFEAGIADGLGDDFAVFENGFYTIGGLFAELAFVEVSSDGIDFARIPSTSVNPFAVDSYDPLDPSDYENLAGDQPIDLGTGFDLRDVADDPLVLTGVVDLTDVRFVRVVDVIGDGSTTDALGNPIHDPYPTAFSAGGFDLEAVGVIHAAPEPGLSLGLAIGALASAARRAGRLGCKRGL